MSATNGEEIYVERNWWILALVWPVSTAVAAVLFYFVTRPAIKAVQLGQPLPKGWSWPAVIVADIVSISMAAFLAIRPLQQLRVRFTGEGIKVPGLWRSKFMRWEDVVYVDGVSTRSLILQFTSSDKTIYINKLYYRRLDELMSLLQARLPESIYWRD